MGENLNPIMPNTLIAAAPASASKGCTGDLTSDFPENLRVARERDFPFDWTAEVAADTSKSGARTAIGASTTQRGP